MNPWRYSVAEAQKLYLEYKQFFAFGPPYPETKNKKILARRDADVLRSFKQRFRKNGR